MSGYSARTALKMRCQRSPAKVMALDLSDMQRRRSFVGAGVVEGVAEDALDAFAGVDVFLDGDFVGSSLLEEATDADVDAFGVFAEDHQANVVGDAVFSGVKRSWRSSVGRALT